MTKFANGSLPEVTKGGSYAAMEQRKTHLSSQSDKSLTLHILDVVVQGQLGCPEPRRKRRNLKMEYLTSLSREMIIQSTATWSPRLTLDPNADFNDFLLTTECFGYALVETRS
jgi:hypothetical protein